MGINVEASFSGYHPAVNFLFFAGAVLFAMFFTHPVFLLLSLCLSFCTYLLVKRGKGLRFLLGMLPFCVALALLNPLLNTQGGTVLFTYFGGRPFTLEALCYGAATGGMFFSVILWFACYNQIMTSDKFIFLFGRLIPALSLVFSMVLRLIPNFQRKMGEISGARTCIGLSPAGGSREERIKNGAAVLSSLTSWALEGAVITADSMRSRGYGSGGRSSFRLYIFTGRDKVALWLLLLTGTLVLFGALGGGAVASYMPSIQLGEFSAKTLFTAGSYGVFLATPLTIDLLEELSWRISKSKI